MEDSDHTERSHLSDSGKLSPYQWLLAQQQRQSVPSKERLLRVREVAALLRVHRVTIRRWVKRGLIRSARSGAKGWIRVPESEVQKLRAELSAPQSQPQMMLEERY